MTGPRPIVIAGVALSGMAFAVQQWSLDRYGLTLDLPERLWVQLGVGWAFLIAGMAARHRSSHNRLGGWMVLFGLIWIGSLVFTAPRFQWHALGWAVSLYGILFVILYMYPMGVLRRWEQWAARAWVAIVLLLGLGALTRVDFYRGIDDPDCCPQHLLFIAADPRLETGIYVAGQGLAAMVFTVIVLTLMNRWLGSSPVGRRPLTRLLLIVGPLFVLMVVLPIIGYIGSGPSGVPPAASGGGFVPSPLPDRWNLYLQNGLLMILPLVILVGLFQSRLSQARVGEMFGDLGQASSASDLEKRLRIVLGDPESILAFHSSASGDLVDVTGRPVAPESRDVITRVDPEVSIIHDPSIEESLVRSAGAAAGLALSNARLEAELRAQLIELQDSRRRLVEATDEARRSVERDLHDGAQQRLVVLASTLRRALGHDGEQDVVAQLLAAAAEDADMAISQLRELARGTHPAILEQAGLGPAVSSLVDRAPIPVDLDIDPQRHPGAIEITAYYVIAESLANVFKHAGASHARVATGPEQGTLKVVVEDDGRGGVDPAGAGIQGLRDRVGAVGGVLEVGSSDLGGTKIQALIPLGAEP